MNPGKGHGWARWGFPGMVIAWPFSKSPKGWMLCEGQEISRRSRLGRLFVNDGCLWGDGDGYKTVNLPDFRNRMLTAADGVIFLVGDYGGHFEQKLTVEHLPPHAHVFVGPHKVQGIEKGAVDAVPMGTNPQKTTMIGHGEPFSILPPYAVVSMIIRL